MKKFKKSVFSPVDVVNLQRRELQLQEMERAVAEQQPNCKLCGKPKAAWQVFCGGSCSTAWELGIRTPEQLAEYLAGDEEEE